MQNRFEYIDILKGVAILLVVFGHLLQSNTVESCNHPIFSFIYSFHMPLFMFISGYIGYKTYNVLNLKDAVRGLAKKIRSLLIPYFVWQLFMYKFVWVSKPVFNISDISSQLFDLLTKWSFLWFLWYIFNLYVFYTVFLLLINYIKPKNLILTDILGFITFVVFGVTFKYFKWNFFIDIDSFMLYGLFFFGGVVISKYTYLSNFILNKFVFLFGLLIFLLIAGQYHFFDLGYKNKLIKLVISGSAIIILYNISLKYSENKFVRRKLLQYGQNSLVIYVTHFCLWTILIDKPVFFNLSNLYLSLILTVMSIIVIETCIFIKKLVSFSPYLDLLLYGEKLKRN